MQKHGEGCARGKGGVQEWEGSCMEGEVVCKGGEWVCKEGEEACKGGWGVQERRRARGEGSVHTCSRG